MEAESVYFEFILRTSWSRMDGNHKNVYIEMVIIGSVTPGLSLSLPSINSGTKHCSSPRPYATPSLPRHPILR